MLDATATCDRNEPGNMTLIALPISGEVNTHG